MLLASLKNFSLAILHNLSFYTDISKNNLFFHQIVQGVCSCFSLFNLQGTPAIRTAYLKSHPDFIGLASSVPEQLLHYSTHCSACQALFSDFSDFLFLPCFRPVSWNFLRMFRRKFFQDFAKCLLCPAKKSCMIDSNIRHGRTAANAHWGDPTISRRKKD